MSEQVVIPAGDVPSAPAPDSTPAPVPAEIAYLKAHGGENVESLGAELESLLKGRSTDSAPSPDVASSPAPVTAPAPVVTPPAPAPQTAQEKALDPYAPEGATDDGDDGSIEGVTFDAEGRARDARTGKYVPLKALHQERAKVKGLYEENAKIKEMQARAEERLAVLNEFLEKSNTVEPAAEEQPAAPVLEELVDPDVDIFKFAKQMKERYQQQQDYVKKLEEKLSGTEQKTSAQIEELANAQMLVRDVQSFTAKQPDLPKAYEHMRNARDMQLQVLGYKDAAARAQHLDAEEKALQRQAIRNKVSYGEAVYKLAATYGYVAPAASANGVSNPTPTPPAPVAAAPVAPATTPAPAPAVDPAAAARVEAIRNGQTLAAPSLSGQGGSGSEGLTVSRLANMSEAEFLDLAAKLGGKGKLDSYFRGI